MSLKKRAEVANLRVRLPGVCYSFTEISTSKVPSELVIVVESSLTNAARRNAPTPAGAVRAANEDRSND